MPRHDQRLLDLAGGNDVPESTLRRWRDEMINLLAAGAPRLDRALRAMARRGGQAVLIDGTPVPTQRRTGKANRPSCSGRRHRHGLHFLTLLDEKGRLIRISASRTGRPHDAAARHEKIVEHLKRTGRGTLADLGFLGADEPKDADGQVIVTGYRATRARKLPRAGGRPTASWPPDAPPSEHGLARLKSWRILTKLRTDPARATQLLRALLC
ncbi:transposase family protein [Streptomyces sp. NK08204]|uniref:transposase family protein n=1 Tax=Streptomyces sp. NK08204 TaxID=2873260 RepID=UPI001CECECAB|nr:transposase family protein [Streptomyces sp. NK08204]